ncbi:MAG TPA: hypothetical protein VFW07_03250 [Parafilimonas sp.]|nr:hypothetical protein [Parafilimonas sp.]
MKKLTGCIFAIIFLFPVSCKKESSPTQLHSSDASASLSAALKIKWHGKFISYNGFPASAFIPDKLFIKNGYARIYNDSIKINKQNYYSTRFRLVLPDSIKIKGDSINFEAGLKNPFNSSFYDPYYGRDITLYIKGSSNEAMITNVATSDINPDAVKRARIKLGQTLKKNLPQLQYNFEDYGTLILQTFNRGVVAYRNNEYLSGLAYEKEPLVGRLKEIGIIFKGSGYIDYIKIYNSVNGKLLLSEDFNTDGQSTVIYWK